MESGSYQFVGKHQIFKSNPFLVVQPKDHVIIGDLEVLAKIGDNGLIVLKYVVKNLNQHSGTTILSVKDICKEEFRYDYSDNNSIKLKNTLETRIRRGIRSLVSNEVIAISNHKNEYWINKSVIWK